MPPSTARRGKPSNRKVAGVAVIALTALMLPLSQAANADRDDHSHPDRDHTQCSSDLNAHLGSVPSPEKFFGFPLGKGQPRVVTSDEIRKYVDAVGRASDRVITGTMAHSVSGQELPYAIVSDKHNVTPGQLKKIAEQIQSLRDPRSLRPDKAARIAEDTPAIVWVAGNVHGGETSGADASLKTLYELAGGLSCDVEKRNDNTVTVIVPTQNPDGRNANRRQNDYGFDLNRDWFARTQPETDGKLELLRNYPPQIFVDAHEMGGQQYFFPPNADPIHHEIADQPVDWINRIGEANKAAFGFNGACTDLVTVECYFNYARYDLFYMGYGDTVPATGFGAAGMTFEKGSASSVEDRVQQQFNTQWATTGWAADNKKEILDGYYKIWKTRPARGRRPPAPLDRVEELEAPAATSPARAPGARGRPRAPAGRGTRPCPAARTPPGGRSPGAECPSPQRPARPARRSPRSSRRGALPGCARARPRAPGRRPGRTRAGRTRARADASASPRHAARRRTRPDADRPARRGRPPLPRPRRARRARRSAS